MEASGSRSRGGEARLRRALPAALAMLVAILPDVGARASDGLPLSRPSLLVTPAQEFAAESYVHRRLRDDTAVLPRSDAYVRDLAKQVREHGVTVNIDRYAPPIFVVPADAPTMRVKAERAAEPGWSFAPLQQQWLEVPIPPDLQASAGTDKEAVIYQPSTGRYYEFWGMERTGRTTQASSGAAVSEWRAAWGGRIERLPTNPGYVPTTPEGYKFGVTATSLPLLAGLMTIAEQRRGEIGHALHLALPRTKRGAWVHPAQRTDGTDHGPDAIPQGTAFRLPADLDLTRLGLSPYALMIARAVQRHGLVIRDTAGVVAFYAENPLAGDGAAHPYFGRGGILGCPRGRAEPVCYPDGFNLLLGFPWDRLQAVELGAP